MAMKTGEIERLLGILTDANPRSVFCEIAFLESWVCAQRRRQKRVPLAMLERALPFLEREVHWKPRPDLGRLTRPAWAQ